MYMYMYICMSEKDAYLHIHQTLYLLFSVNK